ncbi:MAG: inorganic diphosphatase [Gammaproteobacteria bacterium]|nr:inorganic diphosphatase [Gammaproteobacteria bacterium]
MTGSKKSKTSSAAKYSVDIHNQVPRVEVIIEIPRGSFLKRGSTGELDFISPLPCPFNYGSVPALIGLEGDLLDAVVLGPRLSLGTKVKVYAWGAVGLTDRGLYDDKLICSHSPIPPWKQRLILLFFMIYAKAKSLLNLSRGRRGRNSCEGWLAAESALARAIPRNTVAWKGPVIPF